MADGTILDGSALLAGYAKEQTNKYEMENPSVRYVEKNRMCAETLEVFLKIGENNTIEQFSFFGDMAIFTTAVTSLFGESIEGTPIEEVLSYNINYIKSLLGQTEISPQRKYAANFALLATKNALHEYLRDGQSEDFSDVLEA